MVDFPSAVAVPGTAAYAPPLMDFSWLANLPNQFAQGQQNAFDQTQRQRTLALQQPIDASNTQDVLREVLKRGGAQYAEALLPFMLTQQQTEAAKALIPALPGTDGNQGQGGGGTPQGPVGNAPPASASGLQSTNMKTPVTQQGGDAGNGTITDIVTGKLGNTAQAGGVLSRIAMTMNVDPNAPLSAGQQVRVAGLLQRYAPDASAAPAGDPGAASSAPGGGAAAPAARVADAFAAVPGGGAAMPAAAPAPQPQPAPIGGGVPPQQAQPSGPIGPQVELPVNPSTGKPFQDPNKALQYSLIMQARAAALGAPGAAAATYWTNQANLIKASMEPRQVSASTTLVDPRTGRIVYQGPAAAAYGNAEFGPTLDADAERYRQTGTLPPNMGRGIQGQQQATAIRARAAELEIDGGGDPGDWPSRWQKFKATGAGLSQGERTKAVREKNLELILKAANAAIPAALEQSEKVWRSGFVPLNKIVQRGQIMTSDPELRAFGMANLQLAEHWARAMNPTGVMRESDRDLALQFLSTADSAATYKRLVNQLKTQIQREYKSIQAGDAGFESPASAMQTLTAPQNNSENKSPAPPAGFELVH